jgi:hypothetical protein
LQPLPLVAAAGAGTGFSAAAAAAAAVLVLLLLLLLIECCALALLVLAPARKEERAARARDHVEQNRVFDVRVLDQSVQHAQPAQVRARAVQVRGEARAANDRREWGEVEEKKRTEK